MEDKIGQVNAQYQDSVRQIEKIKARANVK